MRTLDRLFAKLSLIPGNKRYGSVRLAVFFCWAAVGAANPLPSIAAVSITVTPASVNLSPGGTQQFTATVTGAADTSVTWTVQPAASGGSILASGLYTAPATVGSYTVIATSNADVTQSATATVSVAGFLRTGLLNPAPVTATLLADGTVLYTDGAISAAETYDPAASASTATGSMTIPRTNYTATLLQSGKVLIAGGQRSGQTTAAAEVYDPVARSFSATGSLSAPREGHAATLLHDGRVLIVGGDKGNCTSSCFYNTAELYDPVAGTFSLATGTLPVAPAIPVASPLGTAASILLANGKVLIAGGGIGGTAEVFDPATELFTPTGAMVNQGDGFSGTLLQNGKVLFVTGGINEAAAATAEIYDPASGIFTAVGNLNLARGFDTATLLRNGQVLIVGGWSTPAAELFDPVTGNFALTGSVQEPRIAQHATLLADGTVLVAGGDAPLAAISSVEVFNPTAKSFNSKSQFLKVARTDHAWAKLADGRLLLTGGEDFALNVLASAEIYDPASGASTLAGSMGQARHGHTATLLNNGNVLIVGGYSDSAGAGNGTTLAATAEIFDPVSGKFTPTAGPNIARAYHTATLLPSGDVLIAGGATGAASQSPTSSVEIYDPVAQTFTPAGNMFAPRYNHAATLLNDGRVLISDGMTIAGTPGNGIGLDEIYDPNTKLFTQAGPREVIHISAALPTASILLPSGQVLADEQSIFDPTSNTVTTVSSLVNLQTLLQDYEFAPLPGGQVLATSNSHPTYLFDPASQTYSTGDSLQYTRSRPTLFVLPNHEVMVAGGTSVAEVEFYVPAAANSNPAPSLSSLNPSTAVAGAAGFTLQVNGTNFVNASVVNFNGAALATAFVSATQLTAEIPAADISNAESVAITVSNPASGSAGATTSNPLTLTILAANVQPVVGALTPASTTAGGPAFELSLTGNGFTQNSSVTFNGSTVPSTYISSTQLQANIPANAISAAGNFLVAVANPGGTPTSVVSFTVNNPVPQENLLSPASATAGSAAETLSVTGANFNPSSQIIISKGSTSSARTTTYVSPTLLQTQLSASDLQQGATLNIAVSNPAPGGGTTALLPFTISDYSVTAPASFVTVGAGQTAVFYLTVAPSNGPFANPITFSVAPLPPEASASFSPSATITPGATSQTVALSITTTAHTVSSSPHANPFDAPFLFLLSFAGIGISVVGLIWTVCRDSAVREKRLIPRFLAMAVLLCAAGMGACSGGGGSSAVPQVNTASGTPAGSYTFTITAASGGVTHTASATITVI